MVYPGRHAVGRDYVRTSCNATHQEAYRFLAPPECEPVVPLVVTARWRPTPMFAVHMLRFALAALVRLSAQQFAQTAGIA
jgi:hypothetical protein